MKSAVDFRNKRRRKVMIITGIKSTQEMCGMNCLKHLQQDDV